MATTWYLGDTGNLATRLGPTSLARFVSSADDPTPTLGGRLFAWPGQMRPGQFDQRERELRADVGTFTTEVADKEMLLMGPVRAEVWSSAEADIADIFATVTDVDTYGRSTNLVEGIRRVCGSQNPRRFHIDLGHLAHALLPGHRLRIDLAAMSFPRFDRRPVSGAVPREILLGQATPSRLILPVVS